ncbi:ABC transporter ATP-binding protein [Nocardiopsis oceani]
MSHNDLAYAVRDVSKVFFAANGATVAMERVSFDIERGSFVCVLGPSGCGKSTLLRILGSLEESTTGQTNAASTDRPAFVFQEHGVFPWFNVLDNVAFGLRMNGVGKRERNATAREWIDAVGLQAFTTAYPNSLSGGMRQRIAIARAFATGSEVLLMDEPLGALDAQTRLFMQEELLRLWEQEKKTVVLVTHSIEEALVLGDWVFVMSARPGRIKRVVDVPFARPRPSGIEGTQEFASLRQSIWEDLRDEVQLSQEAQQA